MSSYRTLCPAKINLGLRVLYRRADNSYHQIESIFIPIDFGDTLEILLDEKSPGQFSLQTEYSMAEEFRKEVEQVSEKGNFTQNLIYKAWKRLRELIPLPGMSFRITKRIPPGAGVGGGSSNAGSVILYAIKKGWISFDHGSQLASGLGADIPFFLRESPCWVTGIGEILEPIQVGKGWGILYFPKIHLDTRWMYGELKKSLQPPIPSKTWKELGESLTLAVELGQWKLLRSLVRNEFEDVAFHYHPELKNFLQIFLERGADYASMTGSGSALYALFSQVDSRDKAFEEWKAEFPLESFFPFSF